MIEITDLQTAAALEQFNANVPRFFFEPEDFPLEAFQVTRFTGVEGISRPYRFTIDLVSDDPSIAFDRLIARKATFTMLRPGVPVRIHGEVSAFFQLGRIQHRAAYRAVIVPRLERLYHRFRSHIYQRLTLEDLVTDVLHEHDVRDVRFDLQGSYDPIEYCVQYNETDLAFVCRLLEREGLFFYFEQGAQHETLVITDHQGDLRAIDGVSAVVYREEEGMVTALPEAVQRFVCRERAGGPGRVLLKDHNYEMPNEPIAATTGSDTGAREAPEVHYEYGEDHLASRSQGDERARRRLQALAGTRHAFHGKSNCMGLRSGYRYTLAGHFRPDFNGDYLLVKVKHRGGQGGALGMAMNGEASAEQGAFYKNKFLCRRAHVPYRPPRRTPVPKVPGLMVAHIDHPDRHDPQDHSHLPAYAHLDDHGRYKATLNFDEDREREPADQSLPIHVAQHYAGADYGTHFPLHGGVEVLLACVNGDPNRPFIVGTVPNPNLASPVTAANNTQNIVRTASGNELLMEDREGATKISLTSAGHHNAVLDDGGRHIGLTTTDGHTLRMHDADREVHVRTTDGHHLMMQDAEEYIQLQTKNRHFLRMDDVAEKVGLFSKDGHSLTLDDANRLIHLETIDGRILHIDDGVQKMGLISKDHHRLVLDDADNSVTLRTANGQSLRLGDDAKQINLATEGMHGLTIGEDLGVISLRQVTTSSDGDTASMSVINDINMDMQQGVSISSVESRVDITAATEIRLAVGGNSITISQTGISINGTDLTEITATLVTIN